MIRPDVYLVGYRVFTVDPADVTQASRLFLSAGISVKFRANTFVASERKARKIEALLATRVKFTQSQMLGFGGFLFRNRKRFGVLCAIFITAILFILSSDLVWDVRVEGCSPELAKKIVSELSDSGFRVGTRWSHTDLSRLEADLLLNSETLSWVNVNRRGTVAYVIVMQKNTHPGGEEKLGYSNVVAECDAVIEEIVVTRGIAMVKPGEVVKRGQILISGIIPGELGGGYCYAEGSVIGRISEQITIPVSENYKEKVPSERKISKIKLNFFDFSINIFKSYRNFDKECAIIEKNSPLSFFGATLPISFTVQYKEAYTVRDIKLTKDELISLAAENMAVAIEDLVSDGTLLRLASDGEFTDAGYQISTNVVFLTEIGRDAPFEVK